MTKKHIFVYTSLTLAIFATLSDVYARQNNSGRVGRRSFLEASQVMVMGNRVMVSGAVIIAITSDTITATTNENNITTTWLIARKQNQEVSTKNSTRKNRVMLAEDPKVGETIDFSGISRGGEGNGAPPPRGRGVVSGTIPTTFSVNPIFVQKNSKPESSQEKSKSTFKNELHTTSPQDVQPIKEAQLTQEVYVRQERHTDSSTHTSSLVPEDKKYIPTPSLVAIPTLAPILTQESSGEAIMKDKESSSTQIESKGDTSLPKDESSLQDIVSKPDPIVFPVNEESNMETEQPHIQVTEHPVSKDVKKDDSDTLYTILQSIIN
jgi:hypothetical protein